MPAQTYVIGEDRPLAAQRDEPPEKQGPANRTNATACPRSLWSGLISSPFS